MVIYCYNVYYNSNKIHEFIWAPPLERVEIKNLINNIISKLCQETERDEDDFRIALDFYNNPWNDKDDIVESIKNINGVKEAIYIEPLTGNYGPPKIFIRYNESDFKGIKIDILSYYDGLVIEKTGSGKAEVITCPSTSISEYYEKMIKLADE